MEEMVKSNALSESLLAREVYCACFPQRDGMDLLKGEFAAARKRFFTENRKTVRVGKHHVVKGFNGKLAGKLTKGGLYWKKTAGGLHGTAKVILEESFDQPGGYVMVTRDFRGIIVSRVFFSKDHKWIKSEYYEPWDSHNARVLFKPCDASCNVERFTWDGELKRYHSTLLFPVPYDPGTAEESILTARFGEPSFLVSTREGDFCYCPEGEAAERKRALSEIGEGTIVLMPAWEVKDGSIAGEEGEEETNVTFTSLEEYAKIEPPKEDPPAQALQEVPKKEEIFSSKPSSAPAAEFTPGLEEGEPDDTAILEAARANQDEKDKETLKDEEAQILQAARESRDTEALAPAGSAGFRSSIRDGKLTGRGRMDQQNGLTAYDGEYLDGKRQGFGSSYYRDGNLCYAGFWQDDKKDGLGVSFRDSDHALHIAKWQEGRPQGFVSLYDKEGNLRYGGRFEDGKKQGAGITVNGERGWVYVGKWADGQDTGVGSAFDEEGNLIYYGSWKDGKREGHGTEFDKNGGIVFDGEWKDDKYHNGILYQKQPGENPGEAGVSGPYWDL